MNISYKIKEAVGDPYAKVTLWEELENDIRRGVILKALHIYRDIVRRTYRNITIDQIEEHIWGAE